MLLAHAHSPFSQLSQSVQNQIQSMSNGKNKPNEFIVETFVRIDLGSLLCSLMIKRNDLEIPITFVSWRGRNSLRPFVSHSSRKFYLALCHIDQTTISMSRPSPHLLFFLFRFDLSTSFTFYFLDDIIEKLTIEEKANNQKSDIAIE